jgi:predicted aldo/keto reductase-like oxidoreductase
MKENSRRNFVKKVIFGSLGASMAAHSRVFTKPQTQNRIKKGPMYYRRLGRTGLYISEISIGGSPIPDWAILLQSVERGVNYIDTSHSYMRGNSERTIGKLFKEVGRDKVYVGTKFHLRRNWSEKSIIESVNGSLKRLGTDYIDVLLIHGPGDETLLCDERVLSAFAKLKKEGKFRFKGLSCHGNHEKIVKSAVECGHYDMIQLGYNVFEISKEEKEVKTYDDYMGEAGLRDLIDLAGSKDIGIIAMKTLKIGGRRQNLDKYKTGDTSIFQAMLKWALENKNIASVVTEILTYEQMEEDLTVAGQSLTFAEKRNLFRHVAENMTDYCHLCGTCESFCPSGIKTAAILRYLAYYENYEKFSRAKKAYSRLNSLETGASCRECGTCEKSCPYGVAVHQRIQDAHSLLC